MGSLRAINNSAQLFSTISVWSIEISPVYWGKVSQSIYSGYVADAENCNYRKKNNKNEFLLLSIASSKSTSINVGMPFINKFRNSVEHRPARADELFREKLYGIPHCFSVDCTHEMYHGSKSSIRERLPSCQQPIMSEACRNTITAEAIMSSI